MLDLLISYLNFFIIGIKFIVNIIAFQPPDPKGYRIKNSENEIQETINLKSEEKIEILFLVTVQNDKKNNTKNNIKMEKDIKEGLKNQKKKLEYRVAPNTFSNFELINFETEDRSIKIPAFLFKPKNCIPIHYLIIYCHGNSGDIGTSFMECQLLSLHLSCNVLCFEYPGYGFSKDTNNINEKRSYYNIRETYKYAIKHLNYRPENIIIYGFSLGTGIAFDLACDKNYPVGGVILQSAFLSIIRTIYNFKNTYYFDLFNSCDKAKLCNSKIFFIHGNKDTIVPYVHGRILSKLIPKKYFYDFYTVDKANHNDILKFSRPTIYEKIKGFLNSLEKSENKNYLEEDRYSDFSSIKNLDEKMANSCQNKKNINEYENNLKVDINSINNNISSHDELKALENKENEEEFQYNIDFWIQKENEFKNRTNNEKTEDNTKNENNCNYSGDNEEKSKVETPKYFVSTSKKLNLDNYNKNEIYNNENNEINNEKNNINNEMNNINNEINNINNEINNINNENNDDIKIDVNEDNDIKIDVNENNKINNIVNDNNDNDDMDISFDKRN